MNHSNNLLRLKVVANALKEIRPDVVFVGGATLSLYSDLITYDVRSTDDVDIIIELISYKARTILEEKLRGLGFVNDIDSSVVCRYKIQGITVDIMPTKDASFIGFENIWYHDGFHNSATHLLDDKLDIRILSAPYFLATKIEAFKGRGGKDGRTSQDFEDIVFVLENRASIWSEIKNAEPTLINYLITEFSLLMRNSNFFEWVDCHVNQGSPPASYLIMEELETLAAESS
jgi:predicted nucleotidyltransferase